MKRQQFDGIVPEMGSAMVKRVLLVEDDRISRESLAYLLRGLGHEVVAVWSAEDAKVALNTFSPDIALLDVRLPGMPGDAFAVFLHHKSPNTKIVFISGEFRLDQPDRFGDEVEFIQKPLDFGRLLSTLQN